MIYDEFLNLVKVDSEQSRGLCPFNEIHEDTDPSFYVRDDGQWHCFGCDEGGGPVKFVQKYLNVTKEIAMYIVDFYKEHNRLPLPRMSDIEQYHQELKAQPAVVKYLQEIGVTEEVIDKLKIGWKDNRLIFPIHCQRDNNIIVNLRRYMPPGSRRTKNTPKTINLKPLGHNRFYPYEAFDEDEIFVFEGEKDMIIAKSQGLNAVTSTGGRAIPYHEMHLFKDKTVYIVTDTDLVGNKLAKAYITSLQNIAKEVHRIYLPLKDFEEYWLSYKDTDIKRFIVDQEKRPSSVDVMNLKDSLKIDSVGETFILENMKVTGKHFNNFTIPVSMTVDCSNTQCTKTCQYKQNSIDINVDLRDIVGFIGAPDSAQGSYLKKYIGCKDAHVSDKQMINAQIIHFQEDISTITTEEVYNQMQTGIYLFDDTPLQTNKTYDFKVLRTTNPKTQQMIFVITEAQECTLSIEIKEDELEYFRIQSEGKDIRTLLQEYYGMWLPHLEVFGRFDLFVVTLMTYLSAIGFYWGNTLVKGWLDALIIGDTRTGKSKMVKNFMNTLNLGAYVSGENSRKTGIVGGIQKLGDNWSLTWGVIPLNDRRLCIIDEASGLTIEDIQELSQMRSEGILSITKIISETTTARTRLLWMTNPRSGKQLNDFYWKGVDALKEFLPVQEDLARFDVVCTAALEDVEDIHQIVTTPLMDEKQLNLWRQLVLFAWNIPPENILIENNIRQYIIDKSDELGNFYKGLPLFLKTNGYEKLTRLAISAAILTFNYHDEKLIITKEHIDFAYDFIKELYAKDSFKFAALSEKENAETGDSVQDEVRRLFGIYENLGILFESGPIKSYMIQEILGIEKDEANQLIAQLLKLRLIKISTYGYRATPQFLDYIRSIGAV